MNTSQPGASDNARNSDSLRVVLLVDGVQQWAGTLAAFILNNSLTSQEIHFIALALYERGVYEMGGGAAPLARLEREGARAQLFATPLPKTHEQAIALLKALNAFGLSWHFDDRPNTVMTRRRRTFTDTEAVFCVRLVARLNRLFADCPEPKTSNAGAWHAAQLAKWMEALS